MVAVLLALSVSLVGCGGREGTTQKKKSMLTPASTGIPYEVLVVVDAEDYNNGAFDAINEVLQSDIPGLPQAEPAFKVSKVLAKDYYRNLRFCRNIIIVNVDGIYSQGKLKFSRDVYSTPQMIMTIQARDGEQFAQFVKDSERVIVDFFTKAEMTREIQQLGRRHSLFIEERVDSLFGCKISIPQELNRTKTAKNFFWASTNKGERDMNFVIYSYPYRDLNTFTKDYFFNKRDSVMKRNIPGPGPNQYMTTARPFVTVTDAEIKGEYAQIARGLWEMENYDMGGPFVSISRVDVKNQRVVVAEAFVYAPGDEKRNLMRRMEAALYTLQLPDELETVQFDYGLEEVIIKPE